MRRAPFQEAVTLVKSQIDIVDVVSRYLPLKRAGRNYLGLCPFHPDKHPSMNVSREKNLFKCFSCGEGGDALAFLMKMERKTFGEVIRELAEAQGVEIEQDGVGAQEADRRRDLTQQLLRLNQEAQGFFTRQLQDVVGAQALAYCAERELPAETVASFGLGFAPPGWERLTRHLLANCDFARLNPDLLVDAGLASPRQAREEGEADPHAPQPTGGGYYDRFRNRLTISIHDDAGRIVAFGARALAADDKPKYLNSPETPLYQKSRLLYGLFQAREAIRRRREAILAEGYFDVIRAHQCGLTHAVGVCGTALTDQHVKLLTRLGVERLYLAFDADEAGQKAALSAIATIEASPGADELTVRVIQIPEGKDPDDFLRAQGEQAGPAFEALAASAPLALDFQCQRAIRGLNPMDAEDRIRAAARLTPVLASVRQPVRRQEYVARYADRVGVRPEDLTLEMRRWQRLHGADGRGGRSGGVENAASKRFVSGGAILDRQQRFHNRTGLTPDSPLSQDRKLIPRHLAAEKALLALLLVNLESYRMALPIVESHAFEDNTLQSLADVLRRAAVTGEESIERVIQAATDQLDGHADLQGAFAALAFQAETLSDQLNLSGLSASEAQTALGAEMERYQAALREHRQREALRNLAHQTRERERDARQSPDAPKAPLLEPLYEFRDRLSQAKTP